MALRYENSGHDTTFSGTIAALLESLELFDPWPAEYTEEVRLLVKKDDESTIPIMSLSPYIVTKGMLSNSAPKQKSIPLAHPSTHSSPVQALGPPSFSDGRVGGILCGGSWKWAVVIGERIYIIV